LLSFSTVLRGRGRGRSCRCRRCAARSLAQIRTDNPPARAAAGQARQVDALRFGEATGEWRGLDPVAILGRCGGRGRAGHRRGWGRCRRSGRRRRLGLFLGRRWRGGGGRRARFLALFADHRDDRADRDIIRTFGNHDLQDRSFIDRFEFHRRLVGFDFRKDIA